MPRLNGSLRLPGALPAASIDQLWRPRPHQEHSSPMRWQARPTLRSSFTILRTASSRPRPRWSNRQSCCSGSRCSMQNT
ncbi:hypothetical protein EYF80_055474 [Liparis tanakae]|uniref:Uncharacterized protein n=1 Tax=Liparis tanakae TaxID=230148 RepID=A0A4Z2F0S1_9TELE|nr:hypothetical protein EYF80_055474 [Liparis tanakae]